MSNTVASIYMLFSLSNFYHLYLMSKYLGYWLIYAISIALRHYVFKALN